MKVNLVPLISLIHWFLIISSSLCQKASERENANELVDAIVKLIKPKYNHPMDPIPIGQRTIGINDKVGLIKVIAVLRIKQGYINQIGGLARVDDAFITEFEDESTLIEMKLGVFDVRFNATIEFEIMGIKQREVVIGSVAFFGVAFDILNNGTTGGRKIDNLKVFEISGLQMSLIGGRDNALRRLQNLQLTMGIEFVMNSNLKRIVNAIVSVAAADSIKQIAGSV